MLLLFKGIRSSSSFGFNRKRRRWELITCPLTFVEDANCAKYVGQVKFADINLDTWNIY